MNLDFAAEALRSLEKLDPTDAALVTETLAWVAERLPGSTPETDRVGRVHLAGCLIVYGVVAADRSIVIREIVSPIPAFAIERM